MSSKKQDIWSDGKRFTFETLRTVGIAILTVSLSVCFSKFVISEIEQKNSFERIAETDRRKHKSAIILDYFDYAAQIETMLNRYNSENTVDCGYIYENLAPVYTASTCQKNLMTDFSTLVTKQFSLKTKAAIYFSPGEIDAIQNHMVSQYNVLDTLYNNGDVPNANSILSSLRCRLGVKAQANKRVAIDNLYEKRMNLSKILIGELPAKRNPAQNKTCDQE